MIKRLIFFSTLLIFAACARDTATEPDCTDLEPQTYQEIQVILNESCAYAASCHLSGGSNDFYDSYEAVKDYLDNDNSNAFVSDVNSGRMPPEYAEPEDKRSITPLEKLQIICWIEDGYPEE